MLIYQHAPAQVIMQVLLHIFAAIPTLLCAYCHTMVIMQVSLHIFVAIPALLCVCVCFYIQLCPLHMYIAETVR